MKKIEIKIGTWGEKSPSSVQQETQIKFEPVPWNALSGVQEPNIIRIFEGVNFMNAFAIKDSHATRLHNITTSKFPALAVRTGSKKHGNTLTLDAAVMGLGMYKGQELHAICAGTWYAYRNGTWTVLRSGLSWDYTWSFVNFQGNYGTMHMLASNGSDLVLKYDGTAVSVLPNVPAGVHDYICTHDNRVYMASGSTVYFSALRKAEDWNTVNEAGQIVVETSDGKNITGLVAGSARLTVFKKNSIHELFGNNPGNYQMKIVTDNLGSPTGHSAQVIEGVIYFLGNDSVYRYAGGSLPTDDFAMQIREVIKTINPARAHRSVSWANGKKYYLAIPTYGNSNPDTILEYDIDYKTWNTWSFASPITSALFYDVAYLGNSIGEVFEPNGDSTDYGTAIPWEWVSKPFSLSSLAAKSRWYRMWVIADIPVGATMNVHVSTKDDDLNGQNWTLVQSIPSDVDAKAREIRIPTTLLNESNWVRIRLEGTGQVVVYEVSRQERIFPFGLS